MLTRLYILNTKIKEAGTARCCFCFIATFLILTFFTSCSDPRFSDKNIEKQAFKITELLDSNSIQIFHKWNYAIRGNNEIWMKVLGDSTIYSCFYRKTKDTCYLSLGKAIAFTKDFPCTISMDTSKFWQFNFDIYHNKIFRIRFVDNHGEDHITDTSISVKKIFYINNPYDTLNQLSILKDKLGVYGISYRSDIGEFIEFWLSSQDKLTYLPDNLNLHKQFEKFWLQDFAGGKMIKEHWNLHKYKEQKD